MNAQAFLDNIRDNQKDFIVSWGTYVVVGTGTTTETTSDTALETEDSRKARQEYTVGTSDVVISLLLDSTDANGVDLTEVGVLDAAAAGNLMMRRTFSAISKTSSVDVWIDVQEELEVVS